MPPLYKPISGQVTAYSPQIHTAPGDMFVLCLGLLFDLDEMEYSHYSRRNYNTTTCQSSGKSTPIYDNRNARNCSGNSVGSGGVHIGGGSGGAPLKISVPCPAPARK